MNLSIGKAAGYNNQILISSTNIEIGSNKYINKAEVYHKKLSVTPQECKWVKDAAHTSPGMHSILCPDKLIKKAILPIDSQEMLTEKHNNEKLAITLLIVGAELIDYHFWKAFTSLA